MHYALTSFHLLLCSHHSCCGLHTTSQRLHSVGSTDDSTHSVSTARSATYFWSLDLFYVGWSNLRFWTVLNFSFYLSWCPPSKVCPSRLQVKLLPTTFKVMDDMIWRRGGYWTSVKSVYVGRSLHPLRSKYWTNHACIHLSTGHHRRL